MAGVVNNICTSGTGQSKILSKWQFQLVEEKAAEGNRRAVESRKGENQESHAEHAVVQVEIRETAGSSISPFPTLFFVPFRRSRHPPLLCLS